MGKKTSSSSGSGQGGWSSSATYTYKPPKMPKPPTPPPVNARKAASRDLDLANQRFYDEINNAVRRANKTGNQAASALQGMQGLPNFTGMVGKTMGALGRDFRGAGEGSLPSEAAAGNAMAGAITSGARGINRMDQTRGIKYSGSSGLESQLQRISGVRALNQQAADLAASEPEQFKQLVQQYRQQGFDNEMAVFNAMAQWKKWKGEMNSQGAFGQLLMDMYNMQNRRDENARLRQGPYRGPNGPQGEPPPDRAGNAKHVYPPWNGLIPSNSIGPFTFGSPYQNPGWGAP